MKKTGDETDRDILRNIKLIIEYDGTGYHGWQVQANANSVQSVVEKAIFRLTGEKAKLTGASRTDTGVHAYGQVAVFNTASGIPGDRFKYALNRILPPDIVVRHSEEVPDGFHPRFSAIGKRYRYMVCNMPQRPAIMRNRAYHVSRPLDLAAMSEAAGHFAGTHDFSAFRAAGGSTGTSVRTIMSIEVDLNRDGLLVIDVTGDGFLYNMVRIMVGTLIQVGAGRMQPNDIAGIIQGRDRKKSGKTAPAHGLYLMEVFYGDPGNNDTGGVIFVGK